MHQYNIPKGTTGKLIKQSAYATKIIDWVTRRDLSFTEFVVDPVSYHNNRGSLALPEQLLRLAERGYAVYGGEHGNDANASYLIAVPYDQVRVI